MEIDKKSFNLPRKNKEDIINFGTKNLVSKGNDLIEAKYQLPLIEQRIIDLAISKINPVESNSLINPYTLTVTEYADLTDQEPNGTLYKDIYQACKKLKTRTLLKHDKDLKRVRIYGWVKTIDFHYEKGTIDFYFDEELEPELIAKSKFTKYHIQEAYKLTGKYSYRIYQIMKKWSGVTTPPVISVSEFRGMIGLSDDEYVQYGHFKNRVLKSAQKELKENTDIQFDFEEIKLSRKIDKLRLFIRRNNPQNSSKRKRGRPKKKKHDHTQMTLDQIGFDQPKAPLESNLGEWGISLDNIEKYGEKALEFGLNETTKITSPSPEKGGMIITKAKDFLLSEVQKNKQKEEEESNINVINENKLWLFDMETTQSKKLMRYDQIGVWTTEPKKVIKFKDPKFKNILGPEFK